jgi:hypothetical protein
MAAPPNKPNIEKSPNAYRTNNQPPAKFVENAPAKTVAQALANSKRQVDAAR